jgi:glutathionyl-hydroquinone reductase
VPVLWDKKKNTIVNNESADIVRMLNDRMNKLAKNVSCQWI